MVVLDIPLEWLIITAFAIGGYAVEQRLAVCRLSRNVSHLMDHLGCKKHNHKKES